MEVEKKLVLNKWRYLEIGNNEIVTILSLHTSQFIQVCSKTLKFSFDNPQMAKESASSSNLPSLPEIITSLALYTPKDALN